MTNEKKAEMIERLKADISVNFKEGDEEILFGFIDDYTSIASNNSGRLETDEKLCPYVFNAVKSAYLKRGNEGNSSSSEGSLSSSYIDIEEKLARDVKAIRIMR